jgi:hypothetical protein
VRLPGTPRCTTVPGASPHTKPCHVRHETGKKETALPRDLIARVPGTSLLVRSLPRPKTDPSPGMFVECVLTLYCSSHGGRHAAGGFLKVPGFGGGLLSEQIIVATNEYGSAELSELQGTASTCCSDPLRPQLAEPWPNCACVDVARAPQQQYRKPQSHTSRAQQQQSRNQTCAIKSTNGNTRLDELTRMGS